MGEWKLETILSINKYVGKVVICPFGDGLDREEDIGEWTSDILCICMTFSDANLRVDLHISHQTEKEKWPLVIHSNSWEWEWEPLKSISLKM
jgi:hypothetical protein